MNLFEKASIIQFHRQRIAAFSDGTVEALGWKGEESQRKRFEIISKLGDFNESSILDLGCGYGDLKRHLDQNFSNFKYLGIDHMPEFIKKAQKQYKNKANTHFLNVDFSKAILPKMDFVVASGALSYHSDNPNFYFEMIRKFYHAAHKAIAFNMINESHLKRNGLLTGHKEQQVLAYCKTLSSRVKLIKDYFEGDFTIFIYRESQ